MQQLGSPCLQIVECLFFSEPQCTCYQLPTSSPPMSVMDVLVLKAAYAGSAQRASMNLS
jgi:hypothetical protein